MPIVKVNDIEMYYEIRGQGEPLLFILGMGMELSYFSENPDAEVDQKYKVILFDNRGAGRTDKTDKPYSIEMMAEDTVGLMDALGIKHAHIIGSSMGSRIAQVIAVKHPERVKSLVLHVAGAHFPFSMYLMTGVMLRIPDSRKKMLDDMGFLFQQKYPPTPESLIRQLNAVRNFDGRRSLKQIKAPTLIVNGTKDQLNPRKLTEELARGIPGAKLILVDGDHMFSVEKPDLLVKPMLKFLAEVDSKASTTVAPVGSESITMAQPANKGG